MSMENNCSWRQLIYILHRRLARPLWCWGQLRILLFRTSLQSYNCFCFKHVFHFAQNHTITTMLTLKPRVTLTLKPRVTTKFSDIYAATHVAVPQKWWVFIPSWASWASPKVSGSDLQLGQEESVRHWGAWCRGKTVEMICGRYKIWRGENMGFNPIYGIALRIF